MRKRLRPAYIPEQLSTIYATPHDHTRWPDHLLRVNTTIELARWTASQNHCMTVADLSCGDGAIIKALGMLNRHVGDYAPRYEYVGPIEETINQIPDVDMFICSETIEHLDDPDLVLRKIRAKAKHLILSTPIGEADDSNPEHYWGWDVDDVAGMLNAAGWDAPTCMILDLQPTYVYNYQIWACS